MTTSIGRGFLAVNKNVEGLRKQYGLVSADASVQKRFDNLLTNLDVMQKSYESSVKRQNNIDQLAQYLNNTTTPQQREDVANRLQYEQIQLNNERMRLENIQRLMDMQAKAETEKANAEYKSKIFGVKP